MNAAGQLELAAGCHGTSKHARVQGIRILLADGVRWKEEQMPGRTSASGNDIISFCLTGHAAGRDNQDLEDCQALVMLLKATGLNCIFNSKIDAVET